MQKRALGYALIILGIITMFIKPITNITGFSVASDSLEIIGNVWFFVAGIGMIFVGGIFALAPNSRSELEEILLGTKAINSISHKYSSVNEGVKASIAKHYGEPFTVDFTNPKGNIDTGIFVYTETKKEAADIANYLVQGKRVYGDRGAIPFIGHGRSTSIDLEKLKKDLKYAVELAHKQGKTYKPRIKITGFAREEYDTSGGGRGWKRSAHEDIPHIPAKGNSIYMYVPYQHYNVNFEDPNNINLHVIYKKK